MVLGSIFQCDDNSGNGSIYREERMEAFDIGSPSEDVIFHLEDHPLVEPGVNCEMGEVSESFGDGLDALEMSLNVIGLDEMPSNDYLSEAMSLNVIGLDEMSSNDPLSEAMSLNVIGLDEMSSNDPLSEAMSLSLLCETDSSHDPIPTECSGTVLGENSMFMADTNAIGSLIQSDLRIAVTEATKDKDTEDVSVDTVEELKLPACLDTDDVMPTGTETRAPPPKMMELVDFILHLEGIKDFYTASMMSEEIMEEIVDNAIAARETCSKYSPSTGEVLHCPDTLCGQDTNYSRKNSSIKNVVSKAKDASPKSTFLPPCRVCGDNASGFHYGANTCEACKGFFRRSIVKVQQNKESYKCVGKGEGCILGPGKRNPCAACRYARCLEVGMSIGAIKTGRYTYEKRTKDTVEVRTMQAAERPSQLETYISDSEVDQIIQSLKEVLLRNCPQAYTIFDRETNLNRQWQIYNDYKAKVEVFGTMSVIPKEIWDEFYKETGIDLDNRQELMKEMACRMEHGLTVMVDFVRAIPGFADLSVSDQTELIKASHFEFFFLMQHKSFNPDLRVVSGMIGLHETEINKVAEKEAVDQFFNFSTSLKNLNMTFDEILLVRGISVTFAASHFEFMFIGHCHCFNPHLKVVTGLIDAQLQDVYKLFGIDESITSQFNQMAATLQKIKLDWEESFLMRSIAVTFPDRCQLEDPKAVEQIQWKLINALRVLAKRKNYRPEQRLWHILDRLTALRTMTEISKELDKQKCSWPVMKEHPLVLDILQS